MKTIKHLLMWIPFHLVLKPLIERNYRMRLEGKLPDEWYWADSLALDYGYVVDWDCHYAWR